MLHAIRRQYAAVFAFSILGLLVGCPTSSVLLDGGTGGGMLGSGVDENADPEQLAEAIVVEVERMVPAESAKVTGVLKATAGPEGSVVGFALDDGSGAFLLGSVADDGEPTLTGVSLEDADGNLIMQQTFEGDATTVTLATGDSIEVDPNGSAVRLTFTLNSTVPPSVVAFDLDEDGIATLVDDSVVIHETENPAYNLERIRLPRESSGPSDTVTPDIVTVDISEDGAVSFGDDVIFIDLVKNSIDNKNRIRSLSEAALKYQVTLQTTADDCPIIDFINRFRRTTCFVISLPQAASVGAIDVGCKGVGLFLDVLRGTTPVPPNPFLSQPPAALEIGPLGAKVIGGMKVGLSVGCTVAKEGAGVAGFIAGGPLKVGCRLYSLANESTRLFTEDGGGISSLVCAALTAEPEDLGLPLRPCEPFDRQCDEGVGFCQTDPDCDQCGLDETCIGFCDPPDPDCDNAPPCGSISTCCVGDRRCDDGCPHVDSDCALCVADAAETCVSNCFPPDPDCSNAVICEENSACCEGDRRCDADCPQEDADCALCEADAAGTCVTDCSPMDSDCEGVECINGSDCEEPFREYGCLDNKCVLCTTDDHCLEHGLGAACRDNDCIECLMNSDCEVFTETCDVTNFACVPKDSGLFTIIGYLNTDGTLVGGPSVDESAAQIRVSGSPSAPTFSWAGVVNAFHLTVISSSQLRYGIEGRTTPDENGETDDAPFTFTSILYGTFGRSNTETLSAPEDAIALTPGTVVNVAIATRDGGLATLTFIVN